MLQQRMKAVVFESGGDALDVLKVRDVAIPERHSGEALIKVDARPVQPADFMFVGNRYRLKPKFPQIAGLEGSGLIVAVDNDVPFVPGERVAFRYPGTWAEYISVPTQLLYSVPTGVPAETAAQFSLNPITAYGLLDELNVRSGDCIAMNAATSSVAQLVAALARVRNIHVFGIVRTEGSNVLPFPTVISEVDDLASAALELSGGRLFSGLLDSIGGAVIKTMLPAMRQGATIVSYGLLGQSPVQLFNADMIYKNLSWKGFGVDYWLSCSADQRDVMLDELWATIKGGQVSLPVRSRYSLDQVLRATADASSEGAFGKVLLVD